MDKDKELNEWGEQLIDAFNRGYELGIEAAKKLYK